MRRTLILILLLYGSAYANPEMTVDLPGGATMEFVWIEPGTFTMGSPSSEPGRNDDEGPKHEVTISQGFWLGKYEVTNAQYRRYKSSHDSGDYKDHDLNGDNQPVVEASWEDAQGFCQWLSSKTGESFRLLKILRVFGREPMEK